MKPVSKRPTLTAARKALHAFANPEKAQTAQRFFKGGPGQYGEGDVFIGARVPEIRSVAKEFRDLDKSKLTTLLKSPVHEERLLALLVLVIQFERGDAATQQDVYDFYLSHRLRVNNWDLVDLTAPKIIGAHLTDKDRSILYELARSSNLWERRIAIISTFHFIRDNDHRDTLAISEILLNAPEDLIHKAVGWMLREVGNRSMPAEEKFLKKHYHHMPRTMLRYAIERFPEPKRLAYLHGEV